LSKNLIKSGVEIPAEASAHFIEAVVLDNRFPMHNPLPKNLTKTPINTLNIIELNVSYNNIDIVESFEWDQSDLHPNILQQFATSLVQEHLEEHRIQTNEETFQGLIEEVVQQIQQQAKEAGNLKNFVEPLVGFNANSSNFRQKEQILKIKLDIHERGLRISDSFDWEVDPILNQYFFLFNSPLS